jgi:hypothetical protein
VFNEGADVVHFTRAKTIIAVVAIVILGAGFYGVNQAFAASPSTQGQTLAQRIASVFGLNSGKVQSVISQYNAGQESSLTQTNKPSSAAQRLTNYEAALNQAVSQGQLTQTEANLVLAEHNKLLSEYASAVQQTESGPTLGAQLRQIHQEGVDWAESNHIDSSWLFGPGA